MTLIELPIFVIISAAFVGLGYLLSLKLGIVGWCIGFVPVGLFWAAFLFFTIRGMMHDLVQSLRKR